MGGGRRGGRRDGRRGGLAPAERPRRGPRAARRRTPATGGHKGYGLGLFAQILGATLAGASFTPHRLRTQGPSDPDDIGLFFLALNPAAFRPLDDFTDDLDAVLDTLRDAPRADPAVPVRIPGDPEWAAREEREALGVPVSAAVLERLRAIAGDAGAEWALGDD